MTNQFDVAVWDYHNQRYIECIPVHEEKRVRIDVFTPIETLQKDYAVFRVIRREDGLLFAVNPDGRFAPMNGTIQPLPWTITLS